MSGCKVIGISGVTCGGKTTLAEKLMNRFENSVLISQDQFYRADDDPKHEWVDVSTTVRHQNWESMASIDWQAFTRTIEEIVAKKESEKRVVVIEGHLIFNYKPISDLCQKKFFLTLEKDECFARRDSRTYLPNDPEGYFDAWVWPMYLKNMSEMNAIQNDIRIEFINGSRDPNHIFNTLLESLENLNE